MSNDDIEDKIAKALERHAGDVDPRPGAWTAIERSARAGTRMRIVGGSIVALAAIAAAVVLVPRAFRTSHPTITPAASQSPSDSPAAALPAGWTYFRDPALGYWTAIPKDWRASWFEGHVTLSPPNLPSAEQGGDTFFVDLSADAGVPPPAASPLPDRYSHTTVDDHPAVRSEQDGPQGAVSIYYRIAWDCPALAPSCPPRTLVVHISSSTAALWQQHKDEAQAMVDRLHGVSSNRDAMPAAAFRTINGTAGDPTTMKGFVVDDATDLVILFLERRVFVDESGAEDLLSKPAYDAYHAHTGGLDLYAGGSSDGLGSYQIVSRNDAGRFDVLLSVYPRNNGRSTNVAESLTVSSGSNHKGEAVGGGEGWVIAAAAKESTAEASPSR